MPFGILTGTSSTVAPPVVLLNSERVITHVTDSALRVLGYESSRDMVGKRGRTFWVEPERSAGAADEFVRNGFWHGSFLCRQGDGTPTQVFAKAWMVKAGMDDYQIIMLVSSSGEELEIFSALAQPGMITLPQIVLRGIIHDMNNALAMPVGMLSLLKDHLPPGDGNALEVWKSAETGCVHLRGIVEQMGDWLRTWMDKSKHRKGVAIGDLVANAVKLATAGSRLKVQVAEDEGVGFVECQEAGIFRVIVNLVLNARQAMSEIGKLDVGLKRTTRRSDTGAVRPYVKISIADTGPGMSPEQLAQLFTDGITTKGHGHGIGLAICDYIIKDHGGYIDVHSVENQGTTFDVWLPAAVRADGSASATPAP